MKLAAKLVLLFLVCLGVVVAVFSLLSVRQAKELAMIEHEEHAADLAATLQYYLRQDHVHQEDVQLVLAAWSRRVQHVRIRVVEPDNANGPQPSVPRSLIVETQTVTTVVTPDPSGQRTMYTYVPLDATAGTSLEVAAPESFWSERLTKTLWESAMALVAVSVVASLGILLGGLWMVGRPLEKLVSKVQRVGEGDLSQPVSLHRGDELGQLAHALNDMCAQLDVQRQRINSETERRVAAVGQLRHADRLRTVGRLAAGLAHEIGTPLNVVSGRAELIAGGQLPQADVQASATTIKQQADRIAAIVRQLLDFARQSAPQRNQVDLNRVISATTKLLQPIAKRRDITLEFTPTLDRCQAEVDEAQVQQVVSNLALNAIQASESGQSVKIELEACAAADPPADVEAIDEPYWCLRVIDEGCGIAAEALNQVFEPFYTTKDVGEGTGLGLSISYGIVREHGGWIEVSSEQGAGTTFTVYLPKAVSSKAISQPTSQAFDDTQRSETQPTEEPT